MVLWTYNLYDALFFTAWVLTRSQGIYSMNKSKIRLALEAVNFQVETEFFNELVGLYSELFERSNKEKILVTDLQPLVGIIAKHTHINTELIDTEQECYDAYMMSPDIDANNPTAVGIYRWFRVSEDGLRKIAKARGAINGFVDLKKGTVGGVWTEFKIPLCIGMGWFNGRKYLTAEQLAAVTLHEIGHMFTDFEMMSEVCVVNCIMQAMAQDWLFSDRVKRTKLLDAATEAANMSIDPKIRDSLVTYDNADSVTTVLLSPDVFTPRSIFGTLQLDSTTCESLADQYAARQGAGDHLAKAMLVFYDRAGMSYKKTKFAAFLSNSILLLYTTFGIGSLVAGVLPGAVLFAGAAFMRIIDSSDEQFNETYDTPRNRLRRLIVETRGTLKNQKAQAQYIKRVLANLEDLEKSMEQFSNSNRVFEGLINTVWRSRGRLVDIRRRQEILESLGNNVLFQTAAQLRNKD